MSSHYRPRRPRYYGPRTQSFCYQIKETVTMNLPWGAKIKSVGVRGDGMLIVDAVIVPSHGPTARHLIISREDGMKRLDGRPRLLARFTLPPSDVERYVFEIESPAPAVKVPDGGEGSGDPKPNSAPAM